ncbi:MAG: M48 family metallopeptidase [Pseudomonadota bacterium]
MRQQTRSARRQASGASAERTQADFFDGDGKRWRVTAAIGRRGLQLGYRADETVTWPFSALEITPKIADGAGPFVITYPHMEGAELHTQDAAFIAALGEAAPHLTARAGRRSLYANLAWIGAFALTGYLIYAVMTFGYTRAIAGMIPLEQRVALGKALTNSLQEKHGFCTSRAGELALKNLDARLRGDDKELAHVKVRVVDMPMVNAFAGPGGVVFLTRGLIEAASKPEEVAGVFAHELGHARALHPEGNLVRMIGIFAGLELITGGTGVASALGAQVIGASYKRDDEREADAIGVDLLKRGGISHRGLQTFFEKLKAKRESLEKSKPDSAKPGSAWGGLLNTHPTTAERIETVRKIEDYPSTPAMSGAAWMGLKTICSQKTKTSKSK